MTDERGVPAKFFHEVYAAASPPPWETGRPQPDVQRWWEQGLFRGEVLDAGCGTGENALWLAERGLAVHAFDLVPAAVEAAERKALGRGLPLRFEARDGLTLASLGRQFDTVLDSALFHIFSDADRPTYLAGLRAVTRPGGRLLLLCFSSEETSEIGPRRLRAEELRDCFAEGWTVETLEPTRYESLAHPGGAKAWRAVFRRE